MIVLLVGALVLQLNMVTCMCDGPTNRTGV